jgi:hypothetical protein
MEAVMLPQLSTEQETQNAIRVQWLHRADNTI